VSRSRAMSCAARPPRYPDLWGAGRTPPCAFSSLYLSIKATVSGALRHSREAQPIRQNLERNLASHGVRGAKRREGSTEAFRSGFSCRPRGAAETAKSPWFGLGNPGRRSHRPRQSRLRRHAASCFPDRHVLELGGDLLGRRSLENSEDAFRAGTPEPYDSYPI
jgi:hypothetical protein